MNRHESSSDTLVPPRAAAVETMALQTVGRGRSPGAASRDKEGSIALAVLEHLPTAIIVLRKDSLALANRAAEMLLARRDGLMRTTQTQGITAWKQQEAVHLRAAIHGALEEQRAGTALVSRLHTPQPLVLNVAPLPLAGSSSRLALITVRDLEPAQKTDAQDETLRKLYGLTQAESAVTLSLLGGRKPKSIARDRGVSVETVRSQIRQILTKTASANQCDLMLKMGWVAGS